MVKTEIKPDAIYDLEAIATMFDMSLRSIRQEIKSGRLRAIERAGKTLSLGRWMILWLDVSESLAEAAHA